MGHAVADKVVYCHEALHLNRKLQTAGYKQEAEKWDSDSDSDVSDDEDLKV
jgi:predicted esterase